MVSESVRTGEEMVGYVSLRRLLPCDRLLCEPYLEALERISRIRGRRMAIEAAIMPVPGSAVAHIVAFTAIAACIVRIICQVVRREGHLRVSPPPPNKSPRRYTMRNILETLPTAPRPITMLTEILDRRSRSLSMRTDIGIRTNVQSAITLITPYRYPVVSKNAEGKHFGEPSRLSASFAGSPH